MAQPAQPEPASLEETARAVVGVEAEVPPDARTAHILGTQRQGSGVVIDAEGHIVTIGYLVLEAQHVTITRHDGKRLPGRVVGYDAGSGLALIAALVPPKLPAMALGDPAAVAVRDPVLVLTRNGPGAAQGVSVVSRREFAGYWEYLLDRAIYTAPAQADYAGAALVDSDLRLVGIGSLFVRNAAGPDTEVPGNLFVPIDRLRPVLGDLVAHGRPRGGARPWLGVTLGEQFGRVLVTRVTDDGPAQAAGLSPGDLILAVGDTKVAGMADLYRALWALGDAGVRVPLTLLHGNEVVHKTVTSADRYGHYRMEPRQ